MLNEIMVKAINYILENLGEDITVEDIAEHCHFSKFYFNRLFKSMVGESVYSFIKRLRIERSAFQLTLEQSKSITEIGNNFGYSSSNFSTAFKKHYGKSPYDFKKIRINNSIRNNKSFYTDLSNVSYEFYNKEVKLVNLPDVKVIYQRFIGDYHNLGFYWDEFCKNHQQYIDGNTVHYELSYDDPILTDPEKCITDIGITTSRKIPNSCLTMIIEGGNYIIYTYEGPNTKLFEAFQGLLGIWLPYSPYEPDCKKRKVVSKYNFVDTDNNFFSIDICVPVK